MPMIDFANRNLFYISINNLLENFYVILEEAMQYFHAQIFRGSQYGYQRSLHGGREYKFNFYADTMMLVMVSY